MATAKRSSHSPGTASFGASSLKQSDSKDLEVRNLNEKKRNSKKEDLLNGEERSSNSFESASSTSLRADSSEKLQLPYSSAVAAGAASAIPNSAIPNTTSVVLENPADREVAAGFDPNAPELTTTWSSFAPVIYCVNTYPNGITLSIHNNDVAAKDSPRSEQVDKPLGLFSEAEMIAPEAFGRKETAEVAAERELEATSHALLADGAGISAPSSRSGKYLPNQFHLRFRDTRDYQLPPGKYFLHRDNYASALENHLSQLHKSGQLASAVLYFGTSTDPFLNLHKKFDVTMTCLEIIERYAPGMVVFQTRSPMIISVLPILKNLGPKAVAAMPIETFVEKSVARYMPGKPRIGERLVAADGLRKQGIRVNLVASPMLPYGDYFRDAWDFAELLSRHGDYVSFGSLASGAEAEEKYLRIMPIAQKLVGDKQFRYLRPHSYLPVYKAMQQIAPEKLLLPVKRPVSPSQLDLFAESA